LVGGLGQGPYRVLHCGHEIGQTLAILDVAILDVALVLVQSHCLHERIAQDVLSRAQKCWDFLGEVHLLGVKSQKWSERKKRESYQNKRPLGQRMAHSFDMPLVEKHGGQSFRCSTETDVVVDAQLLVCSHNLYFCTQSKSLVKGVHCNGRYRKDDIFRHNATDDGLDGLVDQGRSPVNGLEVVGGLRAHLGL